MSSTYLLIAHGSRDPRPQRALNTLAQRLEENIGLTPSLAWDFHPVGTATLELSPLPLHVQIQQFAESSGQEGYTEVKILPLFLLPGVHVQDDIPQEVAIAQQQLGSKIRLNLLPYLGSHLHYLAEWITEKMAKLEVEEWILMAHGSRHPGGNKPIEQLADQVGAVPAYWFVSPDLETQIQGLISDGVQTIGIIPYFMFSGGITDAIAQSLQQLSQQYPNIKFYLTQPSEADQTLVDLMVIVLDTKEQGGKENNE